MHKILTAKELQQKIALSEAAKASAAMKAHAAAEKEKQEMLARLTHPSGLSDDQVIEKASAIVNRAVTGIPKEIYEFWKRQLQPRGYHIRYEVIDYPGGMPGDIGIFLSWG